MVMNPDKLRRYTVGVLVSNEPGVLSRVSGLFSRRGFNIESLAVGPTQDREVSRITIVVLGDDANHGFGVRSMRGTVERYGGTLHVGTNDGVFYLNALLPAK